jgi:hypothetical protein
MVENNIGRDHNDLTANMAVACNCPVIACCFYYSEVLGYMPEELRKQIVSLIAFYKYDGIDGVESLKATSSDQYKV